MAELDGIRVLLAEDDFLISLHVTDVLQGEGAKVTAVSAVEELRMASPQDYDVMIVDKNLRDGQITDEIDVFADAGVRMIFHTGDDEDSRAKRYRDAVLLIKPVDETVMVQKVKGSA